MSENNYQSHLRLRYEDACNDYLRLFCEKHELDFDPDYWVAGDVGTIICINDHYYINFHDLKYDIDHNVDKSIFFEWCNYDVDMGMLEAQRINYPSWVKGAPRRSQEWIGEAYARRDKIRELEQQLKGYIEEDF